MAITIHEMRGVRSMAVNAKYDRTYVRKWRALTDSDAIEQLEVLEATGLIIGAPYVAGSRHDYFAWITSITVEEQGGPGGDGLEWEITANYGPWEPRDEDPTLNPPEVELEFVEFERPAFRDQDGNAIANSSGDPFTDPPINEDEARAILTVTRNEASLSLALAALYKNSTNDADFSVGDILFPPHTLLCKPIRASRQFDARIGWYYRITYTFHIALAEGETWVKSALDRGFRKADRTLILGPDHQLPVEPPLLDGAGAPLGAGLDPVFLEFLTYPERDFSVFADLF